MSVSNNNNSNNMTWWGAEGVDLLGLEKPGSPEGADSREERLTQLERQLQRSQFWLDREWDSLQRLDVYRERQEEADQKKRKEELESWKEEKKSWKKEKAELTASLESSNAILNAVTWGMYALTFMTIARFVVGRR